MTPRILSALAALAALAAPVLAFGGSIGDEPDYIWQISDLAWALPLSPLNLTPAQIEAEFDAPPQADWCDDGQLTYVPTSSECDDFDADLDSWLIDFMQTNNPVFLALAGDPPSFCGC